MLRLKYAVAAAGVLVVIGGGYGMYRIATPAKQEVTPTPRVVGTATPSVSTASTEPKTHMITYNGTSYDPANLTVKTGETVKFVNSSDKDMWPASDDHPAHTIYPEFDADRKHAPGTTFSFTFTQQGAWGFHDHLSPRATGIVTVE